MRNVFACTILLACFCTAATGQGNGDRPKHSLSLSIGAGPFTHDWETFDGYDSWGCGGGWFGNDLISIWQPGDRSYRGKLRTSGAISLSYNYRIKKWLEAGITGTYTGFYQQWHGASSNEQRHYFYFMPGLNFYWLNRGCVEMYSGLSMGAGFLVTNGWDYYKTSFGGGQVTLAGIKIGRGKFYFMSEIGIGMKGLAIAGAGFRF